MTTGRRNSGYRRWHLGGRLAAAGFAIGVAAGVTVVATPGAVSAATQTVVSLTFDNDTVSQYTLGYQQALQPSGAKATFYVNSGTVATGSSSKFMSWPQLSALAAAG